MQFGFLEVLLGLVLAAGLGFAIAWLLRGPALTRSANYANSLEQLLAGTMRDRETALERERGKLSGVQALQQEQTGRLAELEKELEHRELQVVTFREEAIQLARTREELGQRLARREQAMQNLEAALAARTRELTELGVYRDSTRLPGTRVTGPERELAALVAAHEDDLAQLEAQYLDQAQAREAELESVRQRLHALEVAAAELGERDAQLAIARERIAELEPLAERAVSAQSRSRELEQELRDGEAARSKLQKRLADLELRVREMEQGPIGGGARGSSHGGGNGRERKPKPDPGGIGTSQAAGSESVDSGGATPRTKSRRSNRRVQDDLKLVSGIGPAIERALNELGVTSFRQIARWKDKDIERVARKLGEPPERIRRDGWVESARTEHAGKYGRGP